MQEYGADRNRQTINCWVFDSHSENDVTFLRDFVTPYFSDVFYAQTKHEKSSFLSAFTLKSYLNLPEILGIRIVQVMNNTDDERIFYSQWMKFMLTLTCGSFLNRLLIVFNLFDVENS